MKNSTRNMLLFLGVVWTVIWLALVIFSSIRFWQSLVYEIPGIVFIIIALYNWDIGTDFSYKEHVPPENHT